MRAALSAGIAPNNMPIANDTAVAITIACHETIGLKSEYSRSKPTVASDNAIPIIPPTMLITADSSTN